MSATTPVSFDGRYVVAADDLLRAFSEATVLQASDVRTAWTLGTIVGGVDQSTTLAAALAVRAVRLGHVYVDLATAASTVVPDDEEIGVDVSALEWPDPATWSATVALSPIVGVGVDGGANRPLRLLGTRLYLDRYWRHEQSIVADVVRRIGAVAPVFDAAVLDDGLARLFPGNDADDLQRVAATQAVQRSFTVLAGGPGTGKTTTVARIVALLHEQAAALHLPPPRIALAAPTGKAAARLAQAVHAEAESLDVAPDVRAALVAATSSTLHRLLGWQPGSRSRFRHNADNQLPHTVVIVDESSMIGLSMMDKVLAAVRPTARLVLVGDPHQLASVEAGAVLADIVAASLPGTTVLQRVHRYGDAIGEVAAAIDAGDGDALVAALRSSRPEVQWIETEAGIDPSRAEALADVRAVVIASARSVVDAARRGDGVAALAALRSVQVLCAHRRGPTGAARWRAEIEQWLRSAIPGYGIGNWHVGRPLMVTENDYALGVFNGDTGVVIDEGAGRLRAVFDRRGELLSVGPTRLAAVETLYAITIHKAQGSQFGTVVVCLPEPTSQVLTRELLYTAVTRAENRLIVIGSEPAIRAAAGRPVARASGLVDALATVPAR